MNKQQIIRALGKNRMSKVLEIDIDAGVIDLQLKEPYASTLRYETCWVFDFSFYEDYTNKMILDDLLYWFSAVEESLDTWK
mgnify:CR=1 FL=1|jgi:hypothetical protein